MNDIKIAGAGTVTPGEYAKISISGSGSILGPVRCTELHGAGAVSCEGDITAEEEIRLSGSVKCGGSLTAKDIACAGSVRCGGALKGEKITLAGAYEAESVDTDCVKLTGAGKISGLVNADKVTIRVSDHKTRIGSVGGSEIDIAPDPHSHPSIRLFGIRIGGSKLTGRLETDSIEGDEIRLENVTAETVSGRNVTLGKGCRIGRLEYSGTLIAGDDAEIRETVRIE